MWQVSCQYRDFDGITRPLRRRGETPAKAKKVLAEAVRDRQKRGGGNEELTMESPFGLLLDRWLESLEKRRRPEDAVERVKGLLDGETIGKYRAAAEKIVRPSIGAIRLRELNTQRMDGFLSGVTVHVKHVRTVVSQSCSLGVRWNLLDYNPVRETEKPIPSSPDKRVLSVEDLRILMARAVEWTERKPGQGGPQRGVDMTTIVALLLATGERTGEVLALRWCDIEYLHDLSRPVEVTICGTVTKAGKRKPLPKTNNGYRRLKLPEYARVELLSQRERGLPFELVFPTRNGTPRYVNNTNRSWREIRGKDYEWVTPRTFRKTASTAIEREHGAEAAAKQLGHSSPDVTRKHYINRAVDAGDYTETLERLNPFPEHKPNIETNLKVVGND